MPDRDEVTLQAEFLIQGGAEELEWLASASQKAGSVHSKHIRILCETHHTLAWAKLWLGGEARRDEIIAHLTAVSDLGLLFLHRQQKTAYGVGLTRLRLAGQDLPLNLDSFEKAAFELGLWGDTILSSALLRREEHVRSLARFPEELFSRSGLIQGDRAAQSRQLLRAVLQGAPDTGALLGSLLEGVQQTLSSTKDPEQQSHIRLYGLPRLRLIEAHVQQDRALFSARLAGALDDYLSLMLRRNNLNLAMMPAYLTSVAARAWDDGLRFPDPGVRNFPYFLISEPPKLTRAQRTLRSEPLQDATERLRRNSQEIAQTLASDIFSRRFPGSLVRLHPPPHDAQLSSAHDTGLNLVWHEQESDQLIAVEVAVHPAPLRERRMSIHKRTVRAQQGTIPYFQAAAGALPGAGPVLLERLRTAPEQIVYMQVTVELDDSGADTALKDIRTVQWDLTGE